MLTPDGPRLLEVAARPAGGGHQMISDLATGDNHIKRTVRHWVHGDFTGSYRLQRHVCGKFISAPRAGIFRNEEVFDGVDDLPTFWKKNFPFHNGDRVSATEDIFTYLAWVILSSTDAGAVEADYRWVRGRETQIRIDPQR